jgi:hypothetical protein
LLRGRLRPPSARLRDLNIHQTSFFILRQSREPMKVPEYKSPDELYPLRPLPDGLSIFRND